jgi:hypothetical protein
LENGIVRHDTDINAHGHPHSLPPGAIDGYKRCNACGETNIPQVRQPNERIPAMGDRSPKSVQKQASQKQSKINEVNQRKQSLITSQQATKAKAAANKKK